MLLQPQLVRIVDLGKDPTSSFAESFQEPFLSGHTEMAEPVRNHLRLYDAARHSRALR